MYFNFIFSYILIFLFFWSGFSSPFQTTKTILFLVLNIFWIICFYFKIKEIKIDKTVLQIIIVFIGISVFNIIISNNFWQNLLGDHNNYIANLFILNCVIFLFLSRILFLQNLKNKEKNEFEIAFIPITLLICIIGIFQKFGINFIEINDNLFVDRIYSTVGNPNTLGFLTAVSILICIQFKKKYLLLIPIFLTTLLLTESRSAILALAAGICTIGILSENKKFRIVTICSVISVIAATIIIFDLTNFRSLFSRFYIWEATLEFLYKNPLSLMFGSDLAFFSQNIYPYLNPNYFKFEPLVRYINSAHNIILVTIYNYGIIAFSVLIFLLGKLTKKIKNKSILPVLMLILIFALLNNFFIEFIILGLIIFSGIELKSNNYIDLNKFKFVLLLFVILNSYQVYYIVEFEKKIDNVYDNLFETTKLNNSLQELHNFAPYSNTVQNFIVTFNEFETKESKYIKNNIEYQISNYNLKELSDYFYKVKKSNRLNAIELIAIYNRADHLNSLIIKTELQKYFLQVYPNKIDQNGKLYKENKFVFRELNLIQ